MDQPLAAAVPIYVPPQTEVPPPKSEGVVSARITETALVRRNDEDPEADLHYVLIITVYGEEFQLVRTADGFLRLHMAMRASEVPLKAFPELKDDMIAQATIEFREHNALLLATYFAQAVKIPAFLTSPHLAIALDLFDEGKSLFAKAATELQAENILASSQIQREGSVYITMVQLLLQEAGTPWPSLSALIPPVSNKKDERMIDFRVVEPGLQPSEVLDGDVIPPIPVPKDKLLSMSAARSALRVSLQRPYSLLPFSTSDVLPRNVAPLFTAYYGSAPSVAPQRHHPSHPHTLYYAAAWTAWRCQLCQQTVARQGWLCGLCSYVLCSACVDSHNAAAAAKPTPPKAANIASHPHPLEFLESGPSGAWGWECATCKSGYANGPCYYCKICNLNVCYRCAQPPPAPSKFKTSEFDPYVQIKHGDLIITETQVVEQMSVASWPLSIQFNFNVKDIDTHKLTFDAWHHRVLIWDLHWATGTFPLKLFLNSHVHEFPENLITLPLYSDQREVLAWCTVYASVNSAGYAHQLLAHKAVTSRIDGLYALQKVAKAGPASRVTDYWNPATLEEVIRLVRTAYGEEQDAACRALAAYACSAFAPAPGVEVRSFCLEPHSSRAMLLALGDLEPADLSRKYNELASPSTNGTAIGAAMDIVLQREAMSASEAKTIVKFLVGGKPTDWSAKGILTHLFMPEIAQREAFVALVEEMALNPCGSALLTRLFALLLLRLITMIPSLPANLYLLRSFVPVMRGLWRPTVSRDVVAMAIECARQTWSIPGLLEKGVIIALFTDLHTLHPEVIDWRLGAHQMTNLIGAAPSPSDPAVAKQQQQPPAVTVQYALYQLPTSTDNGKYTEYTEQPHFVLQRTDSAPILLSSCILDLPAQCTAPVVTVGVWLCDTLPDVSLFRSGIDSAAQFFSANWPTGCYPAAFIDARTPTGVQRRVRCIARCPRPARYLYVQFMRSGFPNSPVMLPQLWHVQSLRFVGVDPQFMNEVTMDPAARIELLAQVNSARFVAALSENERCVQLAEDDKKNEKIERIGTEQQQGVQQLFVGYTCYRVVVMGPGVYLPYAPPVVVRTSVIIVRGTRRHYVGLAPTWWIWTGRSYGWYGGYGYGYYGGGWGTRTYHSHHHTYRSGTHFGGFGRSHHSSIS